MTIRSTLRACFSLFRIRFIDALQYRLAALSGGSIALFWGLIECTVYIVFFTHSDGAAPVVGGMTLAMVVSYAWIGQALVPLVMGGISGEILQMITKGDVGVELIRPLSLYWHWFARTMAGRLGGLPYRAVVTLAVAAVLPGAYRLSGPASGAGFAVFLTSCATAAVLCTSYAMLVTAVRLNITWGNGPTYIMELIGMVLCGAYLPLTLWPDALQPFLRLQPFAGYLDFPARLYIGQVPPSEGFEMILLQVIWSAIFIVAGNIIMRKKLGTLIVQGG